jgi:hypothetical protein
MTKTAAAVGTVVRAGSWILQNPLVSGEPGAFNSQGVEPNVSDPTFRQIGADIAPDDAPPAGK